MDNDGFVGPLLLRGWRITVDAVGQRAWAEHVGGSAVTDRLAGKVAPDAADAIGRRMLHEAVFDMDVEGVKALLAAGVDVHARDNAGWTPLCWAAQQDCEPIVDLLLTAGGDVEKDKHPDGHTPLHMTCRSGESLAVLQRLIEAGADVNPSDRNIGTPLHAALRAGSTEKVDVLLKHGASPGTDSRGITMLMAAADGGNVELVTRYLDDTLDRRQPRSGITALFWAVGKGHDGAAAALIEAGADVTVRAYGGLMALHVAAGMGSASCVKQLLDAGAQIDTATTHNRQTPLHFAASERHTQVVELLLLRGADVNAGKSGGHPTPLNVAGENKAPLELIERLVKSGADVNYAPKDRSTPLMEAAGGNDLESLTLLLNAGAEVNRRGKHGCTAAMAAAQTGALDALKLLADHGADLKATATTGLDTMAIDLAAATGRREVVHWLVGHGLDYTHRNRHGMTLLMAAAVSGQTGLMRDCIEEGVDPNAADRQGRTALHFAVVHDRIGAVRFLLDEAKVSVDPRNYAGVTPLMGAVQGAQLEAAQLLIDAGADVNLPDHEHKLPPLTVARQRGDWPMVELLEQAGAR